MYDYYCVPIAVGPDQLVVNEAVLRRAWESSQRSTPEDWAEWARHFAVELLRNSPSPALRANYRLAEVQCLILIMLSDASIQNLGCVEDDDLSK